MKVFVYGTLKQGYGNNRLLRTAKFLGQATTVEHFELFHNGGFPMVFDRRERAGSIVGEVYEVDTPTLKRLDQLEGHPTWYQRQPAHAVVRGHDEPVECDIYVMQGFPDRGLALVLPDNRGFLEWHRRV